MASCVYALVVLVSLGCVVLINGFPADGQQFQRLGTSAVAGPAPGPAGNPVPISGLAGNPVPISGPAGNPVPIAGPAGAGAPQETLKTDSSYGYGYYYPYQSYYYPKHYYSYGYGYGYPYYSYYSPYYYPYWYR